MQYSYATKRAIKPQKTNKYKNMKLRVPQPKTPTHQKINSFDGANVVQELLNIKAERKKAPKVVNNPFHQDVQKTINQMKTIKASDQVLESDEINYTGDDDESHFNGRQLHDRRAVRDLIHQNDDQLLGFTLTMFWETWPEKLRNQAGWLMLFNIDVLSYKYGLHSFLQDFDLVFYYVIKWGITLGIIAGSFLFLKYFKFINLISSRAPHFCIRWIANILQMLIIPILLNTLPYGFNTFSTTRIDIDQVSVWDTKTNEQIVLLIIAAIVCAVFSLGFILTCLHIRKYAIYFSNDKHEQFMKQKELQYTLEISNLWRFKHFYLFSSFRRNFLRVYHRNIKWLLWFILILVHSLMVSFCSSIIKALQGSSNTFNYKPLTSLVVLSLWFLYCLFYPPYRVTSTFIMYQVVIFGAGLNIFLALSRAINVKSALLIDENISYVLYTLNGIIIFFLVAFLIIFGFVRKWIWPLNEKYILDNVKKYMRYVKKFKQARHLIQRIHIKEGNFLTNEQKLKYTIESYQRLYEEIKTDYQHILNSLVLELLEELRLAKLEMLKDRELNNGKVPKSVNDLLQLQVDSRNRVLQ